MILKNITNKIQPIRITYDVTLNKLQLFSGFSHYFKHLKE